jgi:hypothetical protein
MFDVEFEYFKNNQNELFKEFPNEYLVIVGKEVVLHSLTRKEAYDEAAKTLGVGNFMLQHCIPGTDAYTQRYYGRFNIV